MHHKRSKPNLSFWNDELMNQLCIWDFFMHMLKPKSIMVLKF